MEVESPIINTNSRTTGRRALPWVWTILLMGIVMAGAYFRLVGVNWDENEHLNPDERFMTMVETSITPVGNETSYFNTVASSLNPNNRGFGFYVYGTFPLFVVRYVAEWLNQTGYDQVYIVGRVLSALFDLSTILLVYLIAQRLYQRNRLSLLAAALYAFSALPIQLSHYFTVDTFTNFFVVLNIYLAVCVMVEGKAEQNPAKDSENSDSMEPAANVGFDWGWLLGGVDRSLLTYMLFGVSLGLAMSSKVSAVPVAVLLPLAAVVRYARQPVDRRNKQAVLMFRNMVLAALVSFIVFRIGQPYAFLGPGFFGLKLNPKWISSLKDLSMQSKGAVDFPPALQWARRPFSYSWYNMVRWGMGLPLGVAGWAGFLWMGWKIAKTKGGWRHHALLWTWTALYFAWQSTNFSKNMRYQLHVYPTLAIMAAWLIFQLWYKNADRILEGASWARRNSWKVFSGFLGLGILGGTFAWAFAFSRIYTRPVTRVEASRWIYQNVPGAINLRVETSRGEVNHPLSMEAGYSLTADFSFVTAFTPITSGPVIELDLPHVRLVYGSSDSSRLRVRIAEDSLGKVVLAEQNIESAFPALEDPRGDPQQVIFDQPATVEVERQYFLLIDVEAEKNEIVLLGSPTLIFATVDGIVPQFLPEFVNALTEENDLLLQYRPRQDETLQEIFFPHVVDWEANADRKELQITIFDDAPQRQILGQAKSVDPFLPTNDPRGGEYTLKFSDPIELEANRNYYFQFKMQNGNGKIAFYGIRHVKETGWDDVLPLGIEGFNPFDHYMGVYQTDLNFEMYWDDNPEKLERFVNGLNQADYLFISSNRQWGTTTRVPERYPLTTTYYRELIGCPAGKTAIECYSEAEPGMFAGGLGFDLIKVVQSDPNLGSIRFNTQFADESFTVYDHPKVLIFKKSSNYSPEQVKEKLTAVDLTTVIHLSPRDTKKYPGNLLLPQERLQQQRSGGTWSELFDREALINRQPVVGVIAWYFAVLLLGLVNYPLVRLVFRGLSDKGYPFSRLVGMLLLAYFVWLAGSLGLPFTRWIISIVFLSLAGINLCLFLPQREEIIQEFRAKGKYYLSFEALLLAFFLLDLLIRVGNPDLWHPYKGGEKPMDFSYLNAVIKSTTFPPYDPWFSGGYINYYYYGFVIVGVLIKWLGMLPSIAYNLVLPTLFTLTAAGAFSIVWNLFSSVQDPLQTDEFAENSPLMRRKFLAGLSGALGMLILGNLGTLRMIWQAFQRMAAPGGSIEGINVIRRWIWAIQGIFQFLGGTRLPIRGGDWYWVPSRALPGEPITEFPFFTFLYGDLHAHMIALPITLLVIGWLLAVVKGRWEWGLAKGKYRALSLGAAVFLGALIVGALRPTNTWDLPVYLGLSLVAVSYTYWRYAAIKTTLFPDLPPKWRKGVLYVGLVLVFVGLVFLLYQPFADWYGQGYNKVKLWEGERSPFWSYFTHWGLFLFVIVSWLIWETRDWMAKTPFSALNQLRPYRGFIQGALGALGLIVAGSLFMGIKIAWLVLPISVWAAVLLFRPGQPDEKRLVLFLVGSGCALTLAVELIVLDGDVGRMNTVFKFYLQAWTLLSISAAAGLMWLLPDVKKEWHPGYRSSWRVALAVLLGAAALFPVLASADKITDRMSSVAPHTLDGMTFMAYSRYFDQDRDMVLLEDYNAIKWMQENVQGSPTIVEGHTTEYKWGSRYTIYTGLPGVVGWNWHQRQQRTLTPSEWVSGRVAAINVFYNTTQQRETQEFLRQFNVEYVVVGQLERAYYEEAGLQKFPAWNGKLWEEVYRDGDTAVYRVLNGY